MSKDNDNPALMRLMAERGQHHVTRKEFFQKIEAILGRPVITYFSRFGYADIEAGMTDRDVDMFAGLLQTVDLSKGLALMISSPGGDGLSAERIVNVCRSYSDTDEYWAIIPGKAKSAATMVCFGASKLMMGPTSELGPVDPQVPIMVGGSGYKYIAAHHIVNSYKNLFEQAESSSGNLEPYIQQLHKYEAWDIAEYESLIDLSVDMSVKALKTGMLPDCEEDEIEKRIEIFLTPSSTKTHGRPIYRIDAEQCGLITEAMEPGSELWNLVYELYIRTNNFVSNQVVKCIESKEESFVIG